MRLFYAVFVPKPVQQALAEAQKRLVGRWKPVLPAQMHVTLLFLGEVHPKALERLVHVGRDLGRSVPAFTAVVRGTGYFPNEGKPRVWFAKAEGEGFEPLAEGLKARLSDLIEEDRPFKAHITLARRKGPAPRVGPVVFNLEFPVRDFALVHSELRREGPVYTVLERFALKEREENGKPGQRAEESLGKRPEAD
ncbi:RNA 2',3'-cyclic phosphodiesterase [Marinithermus hydrothermalis]|uniref:RNA 2',3'-cyclic phosphodiesterase n=1 Tax=Marinithermus hydrothermalis (strain DSM 14884 / JCM 11576 / T1) TaxID=869210 RepID=F2NPY9_MARHT|nr:RNA 2',3'-cyclic phosphodiesterase [Marinithermus hydrothermalis]AEB11090.1 2'-5' RNA ligase [Marinithermus hydrothermalis DSM 14884]